MAHNKKAGQRGRPKGHPADVPAKDDSRAHNATVRQMSETKADDVTVYRLSKQQADAALKKLKHMNANEPFLNGDKARELQENGGMVGKLARHAAKWLTDKGSETTIPLTDREADELNRLLPDDVDELLPVDAEDED